MWWIFGGKTCVDFPREKMKSVTENFTTFFTSRQEIRHLELTLGASSPNNSPRISFAFAFVMNLGHTPSTAGTFRKKFQKNSGKTPETLSERSWNSPREYGWDAPSPIIQGI